MAHRRGLTFNLQKKKQHAISFFGIREATSFESNLGPPGRAGAGLFAGQHWLRATAAHLRAGASRQAGRRKQAGRCLRRNVGSPAHRLVDCKTFLWRSLCSTGLLPLVHLRTASLLVFGVSHPVSTCESVSWSHSNDQN